MNWQFNYDNTGQLEVKINMMSMNSKQYHNFSYIVAVSFIGGENHRPVASH
jgi:hypothetical protein